MFYEINGEKFRVVYKTEYGNWLISFDYPSAPVFSINDNLLNYIKINTPEEYIFSVDAEKINKSIAEEKRYRMIEPFLEDDIYIIDKDKRNLLAITIAKANNTSKRRVLRLYYRYLATKSLIDKNFNSRITMDKYKDYDWAIKKYYFSAKKISLKDTYDLLLLGRYMDDKGKLLNNAPTWDSFRHFFYKKNYNKSVQKDISRDGLSNYQRNKRPLFGQANSWIQSIGYYEMDATEADIYLVSRFDPKIIIGRPHIYMAVDRVTQIVAGIYVGFNSDDSAVISCLANAASDKVEFCKQYGIEITKQQWPSAGLPGCIITDQGRDFMSNEVEKLCLKYDIELEYLPPFRPDKKSLVEKTFDLIQEKYKPFLRGKGVIEEDSQERWATDYRCQATLNIEEFIKILIHCILYINGRLIKSNMPISDAVKDNVPTIPKKLWEWLDGQGKNIITPVVEHEVYILSLKRKTATINRKGIYYNGFWYKNSNISKIMEEIKGVGVTIFYDVNNISIIYLFHNNQYLQFNLPDYHKDYAELNVEELNQVRNRIKEQQQEIKKEQIESRVNLKREIKTLVDSKTTEQKKKPKGRDIKDNQKIERENYL